MPTERDKSIQAWERQLEELAMHLFNYNTTLAARLALGHGIDKETVAESLRSLAYAIETGDVAESMYAVDDGHTLDQLLG